MGDELARLLGKRIEEKEKVEQVDSTVCNWTESEKARVLSLEQKMEVIKAFKVFRCALEPIFECADGYAIGEYFKKYWQAEL